MSLRRMSERREAVEWEPSEGGTVPVQVEYLGRKVLLHADRVTVWRTTFSGPEGPDRVQVDVTVRTRDNGARFGQWAWHSADGQEDRRFLGEVTDMRVWSLLKAEAPEAIG